jgi:hypothetical protein
VTGPHVLSREELLGDPRTPLLPPAPVVPLPEALAALLCVESLRGCTNWRTWERGVALLATATQNATACASTDEVTVHLRGSRGDWYTQNFRRGEYKTRDHGFLAVACSCPGAHTGRSACKHAVAAGLYVLGHGGTCERPDSRGERSGLETRLAWLGIVELRRLVAAAADTHPDVSASVRATLATIDPSGGLGPDTDWEEACADAIAGMMDGFDWARDGKRSGSALCDALQPLLDTACSAPPELGTSGLTQLLCTAIEQASGDIGDRYGDLGRFADRCVDELQAPERARQLTADRQESVATSLLALTANMDLVTFWACLGGHNDEPAGPAPITRLLGPAGHARLRQEQRDNTAAVAAHHAAPPPLARAAQASRERTLRTLQARGRLLDQLLTTLGVTG